LSGKTRRNSIDEPADSRRAWLVIFPISDDDRHLLRPAYVSIGLLVMNVLVFLWQQLHPEFTYGWSVIPREISTGRDIVGSVVMPSGVLHLFESPSPVYLTIFSAMFMHGDLMHLGGNMLYLWIFGDNVEHRFGGLKFLAFYLVSGIVATFAQVATNPQGLLPNLGASGAISGILGAYLVLFPRNKVNAIFFFRLVSVPAVLVLGMWGLMQFVSGAGTLSATGEETGGVAYAAHIGGFVAGLAMGLFARVTMKSEPDTVFRRQYERDPGARRYW
jgi:membrane associated rhomboid family serine protease